MRTLHKKTTATVFASVAVAAAMALTGCSGQDPDATSSTAAGDSSEEIPTVEQNDTLRNQLPDEILKKNSLTSVNTGSFPPYTIVGSDKTMTGATADIDKAMGQLWGITIKEQTVDSLPSILTGLSAGRYDLAMGPTGDFKERQGKNAFIDYVQEFVVFAVPSGNPKGINDLDSACGAKIAVQAGGSAEKVIKTQADKCKSAGKNAIEVMSFKDQPSSILAVQSGRADAFFSSRAPLTYFVEESNGKLELAGTDSKNGFDTLYQGAVVQSGSKMETAVEAGMQELFDNGTYAKIMKKWGLEANMIDKPGKNLAVS
jgi:polar amino acid transport system substrate-binding protein